MSETAKRLFSAALNSVKDGVLAIAPGLQNFWAESKAEVSRLGTQGGMELASALFNENAFVPYGPGQYTPAPEHGLDQQQEHQLEMGRER